MSSSAESVRVIARFRPQRDQLVKGGKDGVLSASKQGKGVGTGVAGGATATGTVNAATGFKLEYASDGKSLSYQLPKGIAGTGTKPAVFTFDAVLNPSSTQEQAFDAIAKDTIADVLKGYNGTIFAYGQTGSGKSFSMFGPSGVPKLRGVIPRAADAIFEGIAESDEVAEVTIKVSMLEIYKEGIRDLLQPKATNLKIRELPSGETFVQGLSDEYVAGPDDILQLLVAGEKSRTTSATDMNEVSSRSHSVLIIVVNMKLKDGSVRVGKLNLADLAGSERIERTNATGNTLEEAKKINQSLSALGVLTFLLSDSLGGNTKTTLLLCMSAEENDCNETFSSLNFGKRCKRIKNNVSVNVQFSVAELMVIVAGLRKELTLAHKTIAALQSTLRTLAAGGSIPKEMMNALLKPMAALSSGGPGATGSTATAEDMHAMEAIAESSEGASGAVPAPMLSAALAPLGAAGAAVAAVAIGSTAGSASASSAVPSVAAASPRSPSSAASPRAGSAASPAAAASAASNGTAASPAPAALSTADDALPGLLDEEDLVAPPTALMRLPTLLPTLPITPPTSTSPVPPGSEPGPSSDLVPPMLPPEEESSSSGETFKLPTDASEDLQTAHDEIVALRSLLEISQQSAQAKEEAWENEREALQAELAAAKAASASNGAAASPPAASAGAAAAGGAAVGLLAGAGLAAAAASSSSAASPSSSSTSPSKLQLTLDTSSSSSSAGIAPVPVVLPMPLTSPRARAPSSVVASSAADSALISSLRSKNDRLEKQMAEMKETWTAYLDLILENQKAQEAERAKQERAMLAANGLGDPDDASNAPNARGPKIVKPVKRGFFSTLFRSKSSTLEAAAVAELNSGGSATTTPQRGRPSGTVDQGSASASSSAFNSPNPTPAADHRRTGSNTMTSPGESTGGASRRQTMGPASAAASPASPSLARSRSTVSHASSPPSTPLPPNAARASFANAIRIGFLSKKPVGFSMSRAWKQRLFVLRPTCMDWYQIDPSAVTIQANNAAAGAGAGDGSVAAAASSSAGASPSPSPDSNGLSQYFCPSNLLDHLRGSISLDCQTSCVCVSYADAPFGFELTTRDKHSKLQAATDGERQAWVRDLLAVLQCIKSGMDPAMLIPGAVAPNSSPDEDDGQTGFTLDPNLVSNANFLLQSHLERLPEPSPPAAATAAAATDAASAAAQPSATATTPEPAPAVAQSSSASPAAPAPSASS